jgi:hypothetical protein
MVGKIIGAGTGNALPRRTGHLFTQSPLAAQAEADLALVRRRKGAMGTFFFEVGEALLRLRKPGVAEAMGHADSYAMVRKEAGLAPAQVDELVEIVTHVRRDEAERMGHGRAAILARLAATTAAPPAVAKPAKSKTRKARVKPGARSLAASIEAKLHELGVTSARVKVVAGALEIRGVPVDQRALLKRAL